MKGLSRMQGNLHVRFLGGGGAVMRHCYPTGAVMDLSTRLKTRGSVCSILVALKVYHLRQDGVRNDDALLKIDALLDGRNEELMQNLETAWNGLNPKLDKADKINSFMKIIQKAV